MRIPLPDLVSASDIVSWADELLKRSPTNEQKDFVLIGKFSLLARDFFRTDPPIVGAYPNEKLCWSTKLTDATGTCKVKV